MKKIWHQRSLPAMRLLRHILVGLVLLVAIQSKGLANEKTDFASATKIFAGGFYPQAEKSFAVFTAAYTNSPYLAEAYFDQAYSRFSQSNYDGALKLFRAKLDVAGDFADRYYFWIAQTLSQMGNLKEAADDWGTMIKAYPESLLRLPAAHNQALAFSKLGDWPHVIELLGNEKGDFQSAARADPANEWAVNGFLLLAEAYYHQHQYAEGEKVILAHPAQGDSARRRQLLLCRIQLASGRAADALLSAAKIPLSVGRHQDEEKAETISLVGEIYESLGQLANAVGAYTNNLGLAAPAEYQRAALGKTIQLILKQNKASQAMELLTDFVAKRPAGDPSLDLACLSLGELKLKASYLPGSLTNATDAAPANLLQQAVTNFSRVIVDFTNSPLRGKAYLDRGWCYWTQGDMAQAGTNFFDAIALLTNPEDHALAQFKLADTQFSQHNYNEAFANYTNVLAECDKSPALKNSLYAKALYQVLRASMERNDAVTAGAAMANIVDWYPDTLGNFTDECLLLYGEFKTQKNNYGQARKIFSELIKAFPDTPVMPEVKFAIARTYALQGNWTSAAACFDAWVTNYPSHPLLPQAEFSRALACDKAGYDTRSLGLFTNFVARFSTNNLAPWAQNWIADYYFNQDSFIDADKNYQALVKMLQSQNYDGVGDLLYQARLMVGRSAYARQEFGEAGQRFGELISTLTNNTNAPPVLLAQTYFALGDTRLKQFQEDMANTTNTFCSDAVNAFSWITNNAASSRLAPLAMGRIGDCNFEWAKQNTNNLEGFTNAMHAYENVLQMPQARESARDEAGVSLGLVLESLGRPDEALDHYFKVLYETDSTHLDPVWVKEAGLNAARLFKARNLWGKVVIVYQRVLEVIPSLRPILEEEISRAKARQAESAKK